MKLNFFSTPTPRALFLCTLAFLLAATAGKADEGEGSGNAGAAIAFADALFQRDSFYRAAMEYERFIYFYPEHPDVSRAHVNIAASAKRAGTAAAATVFPDEGVKSQPGFARHLFDKGHYYQAVTEYERFIYFNPDHPAVPEARLKIALCHQLGGQYEKAIELFRTLTEEYRDQDVGKEAAYHLGRCFLLNRDYEEALTAFDSLIKDNPGTPLADRAQWSRAWTSLCAEDYGSAQEHLLLVRESSDYGEPSRELAGALEELPRLPRKSPFLAGFLAAAIPGAGHLYAGKKKQALFTFITNALLAFGTYEAFSNDLYTAGGFLSLFSINYYSGNIFGALNSTHGYNRKVKEAYLEPFRRTYEPSITFGIRY